MSTTALIVVSSALEQHRARTGTRWRRLSVADQALLALAHLRKGETYADLATGFGIGVTTAHRYAREAVDALAAQALSLAEAMQSITTKAFVILDGTLLRMDRCAMTGGRDRPYDAGQHKAHGVNVQVVSDPMGRLIWASPVLPGARHDMGAAREHGLIDTLSAANVHVVADSAYRGAGRSFDLPQRRRPADPEIKQRRRLSRNQRAVNAAHAAQRGPGERANAALKSWRVLRKLRCCPRRATALVQAVQVLILAG